MKSLLILIFSTLILVGCYGIKSSTPINEKYSFVDKRLQGTWKYAEYKIITADGEKIIEGAYKSDFSIMELSYVRDNLLSIKEITGSEDTFFSTVAKIDKDSYLSFKQEDGYRIMKYEIKNNKIYLYGLVVEDKNIIATLLNRVGIKYKFKYGVGKNLIINDSSHAISELLLKYGDVLYPKKEAFIFEKVV